MFKEGSGPMFLLWAFCMLLTAATELIDTPPITADYSKDICPA